MIHLGKSGILYVKDHYWALYFLYKSSITYISLGTNYVVPWF